jgi:hypothetical protein
MEIDTFNYFLPPEIWNVIFGQKSLMHDFELIQALNNSNVYHPTVPQSILQIRLVCKKFLRLVTCDKFWKKIYENCFSAWKEKYQWGLGRFVPEAKTFLIDVPKFVRERKKNYFVGTMRRKRKDKKTALQKQITAAEETYDTISKSWPILTMDVRAMNILLSEKRKSVCDLQLRNLNLIDKMGYIPNTYKPCCLFSKP